jgi:hypothetical protein
MMGHWALLRPFDLAYNFVMITRKRERSFCPSAAVLAALFFVFGVAAADATVISAGRASSAGEAARARLSAAFQPRGTSRTEQISTLPFNRTSLSGAMSPTTAGAETEKFSSVDIAALSTWIEVAAPQVGAAQLSEIMRVTGPSSPLHGDAGAVKVYEAAVKRWAALQADRGAETVARGTRDWTGEAPEGVKAGGAAPVSGAPLAPAAPVAKPAFRGPEAPTRYQPHGLSLTLGIAAVFASLLPTVIGVGSLFDPGVREIVGGLRGSAILLAVGGPLSAYGAKTMWRIGRYPANPDHPDGSSSFVGFALGMTGVLLGPVLIETAAGRGTGIPAGIAAAGGIIMTGALAMAFLEKRRSRNGGISGFLIGLAAFGFGLLGMVSAQTTGALMVSFLVMMAGVVFSPQAGAILGRAWIAMKAAFARFANSRTPSAPRVISSEARRAGTLIGGVLGLAAIISFSGLTPLAAIMGLAGVFLGSSVLSRFPALAVESAVSGTFLGFIAGALVGFAFPALFYAPFVAAAIGAAIGAAKRSR